MNEHQPRRTESNPFGSYYRCTRCGKMAYVDDIPIAGREVTVEQIQAGILSQIGEECLPVAHAFDPYCACRDCVGQFLAALSRDKKVAK